MDYLSVLQISLFTDGTIVLITALVGVKNNGGVINTAYTFVTTDIFHHFFIFKFIGIEKVCGYLVLQRNNDVVHTENSEYLIVL